MIRRLFRRRFDRELAAEIDEHIRERAEELMESGMSREDADQRARREFGNSTLTVERSRDIWSFPRIESFFKDIRYAVRSLRHQPVFTIVVAVTLALGIGANAAIFGLVDALWFRPLAVPEPSRVLRIFQVTSQDSEGEFSFPEYQAMAEQANAFDGVVALGHRGIRITAADGTHELLLVNVISDNFFRTLRVKPELGSLPGMEIHQAQASAPVVAIGYTFWQRHFGGSADAIGHTLRIERDGRTALLTVIGVLPPTFREIQNGSDRDVWMPIETARQIYPQPNFTAREARWFMLLGRMGPGTTPQLAQSQIQTIAGRLTEEWPGTNKGRSAVVMSDLDYRVRAAGGNGPVLLGVAFLMVLLCAVNVANLLLARNLGRRTEIGVRLALGVHRFRLARQLMTENALLGALGLGLGVVVGRSLIQLLPALFVPAPGFSIVYAFRFDTRVLIFSIAVSAIAVGVFGVLPSLRASRLDLVTALKGTSRSVSPSGNRVRRWLVVAQIAVSLTLLAGAGALVESFVRSRSEESGFTQKPLLVAWLGGAGRLPAIKAQEIEERVRAVPGVSDVAICTRAPLSLSGGGYAQAVTFPGRPDLHLEAPLEIKFNSVSSNFLRVTGTPLLRGREFDEADQTSGPLAALINQRMAQRFWPKDDPIGKTIRIVSKNAEYRIIGVVANAPINAIGEQPEPYVYLPFRRDPTDELTVIAATTGNAAALASPVRRVLIAIDRSFDPYTVSTFQDLVRFSTGQFQLTAILVSSLGVIAVLLTAIGVYGMVSFGVRQRTREIGIRSALGAARGEMFAMVLRDVCKFAAIGMAIGIPCAVAGTYAARSLLFGVRPWDPGSYFGACLVLSAVLLIASFGPAHYATRIDPITALREE